MKGESKKVACLAGVSNLVTALKLEQAHYAGYKKGVTLLWGLASRLADVLLARHAGKEQVTRPLERPCQGKILSSELANAIAAKCLKINVKVIIRRRN